MTSGSALWKAESCTRASHEGQRMVGRWPVKGQRVAYLRPPSLAAILPPCLRRGQGGGIALPSGRGTQHGSALARLLPAPIPTSARAWR